MSGKSHRGKGKHSSQSRKSKAKQRSGAMAVQQVVARAPEASVAPAATPAPRVSAPAPPLKTGAVRYPYINAELRRIGILAGVMVVILVVLAFVLPSLF